MARAGVDPLRKGTLAYRQHGVGVSLEVLEGTFASAGVDAGTRHLLRWLATERYARSRRVLDVGCGYGPLGLWLAAADHQRRVLAVDRDARAVEAAMAGAVANGVADRVGVFGGLGYDELGPQRLRRGVEAVDLVVSNVPAKIGPAALGHLVLDASHHLAPAGLVALVVVARLTDAVRALLADPAVEVLDERTTRAYTTFEYRFSALPAAARTEPGFERGVYGRRVGSFEVGARRWDAVTSWSIPEFDGLSHGTVAALAAADATVPGPGPLVVAGVGQGHIVLGMTAGGFAGPVRLVDRDLLALRTAGANVEARDPGATDGQLELRHHARLEPRDVEGAGLVVVELPAREPVAITAAVLGPALARAGDAAVVLHGRTADVARVVELSARHGARLDVRGRHRVEGHVAVLAMVTPTSATATSATPHR